MSDHIFMSRALQLAQRGLYTTHPNPRVGCVLAKAGEIIGEGWHEKAGEPHAEIHALRQAGDKAACYRLCHTRALQSSRTYTALR